MSLPEDGYQISYNGAGLAPVGSGLNENDMTFSPHFLSCARLAA